MVLGRVGERDLAFVTTTVSTLEIVDVGNRTARAVGKRAIDWNATELAFNDHTGVLAVNNANQKAVVLLDVSNPFVIQAHQATLPSIAANPHCGYLSYQRRV
ncbi:MAG: hypothetical protein R3C05_05290 [Pirellulaceae bacterium]